ncbi:MAG: hypothetical protein CXT73_00215 [Methanobacteriota archaeon]|jgi:hypothetical protein|nr:MAG: hypothetical protein CXT73_00215 [Euryarchaeota archaeon]
MKYNDTTADLIEQKLSQSGKGMPHRWVPEQEANFDAGFMPTETPPRWVRRERIDGKLYEVFTL